MHTAKELKLPTVIEKANINYLCVRVVDTCERNSKHEVTCLTQPWLGDSQLGNI